MDTSPFNTEDQPTGPPITWEQFKANIRNTPRFNAADEIQNMHGTSDAIRAVLHAIGAKSAAGYQALWNAIPGAPGEASQPEHVDATAAALGPKFISPEGQYALQNAIKTGSSIGQGTGISDLAHSLSSKYGQLQGTVEPLIQKYAGVPAAATAHAVFEAAPQAAIPGLGEEKALAGATGDALEQLARHHITAPESPLEFAATDPGRVHLNSSPAALEREGVAAKRTPQAFIPPAITDDSPMPPHNDSYVGNQAFAKGGEVGMLGDALETVSHLPTPAGLAAKYADNPKAIENFHNWAKQTAVTDDSGAPAQVFHNTDAPQDFAAFRAYRGDIGSHFGTQGQANERGNAVQWRDPPAASDMTNPLPPKNQQAGQRTIPAYLSIQNPLRTPDLGEWGHDALKGYLMNANEQTDEIPALEAGIDLDAVGATKNNHQLRKVLQDHGYDGIVYQNTGEPNIPPAIQLARQDAQQRRDAFAADPQNKPYMQARVSDNSFAPRVNGGTADMKFPAQHAQYNALNDQYQLADQAYRRFYHAPDISSDSYVAFDPSQVKSAVGNTGEFDPGTQDINHASGGEVRGYADGGGVEGGELGILGDAIKQVSHLPLTATAAEAAPLAERVAQYGGATYSPTSGALHRTGTVTADPASTVALDHVPNADEIHHFLMLNHGEPDHTVVLHITSADDGKHFMRMGRHAPSPSR